eukprot:3222119-Prymnesium_polylepis.1
MYFHSTARALSTPSSVTPSFLGHPAQPPPPRASAARPGSAPAVARRYHRPEPCSTASPPQHGRPSARQRAPSAAVAAASAFATTADRTSSRACPAPTSAAATGSCS